MATITLIGLGPGGQEGLTLGAVAALKTLQPLFLRTEKHPAVSILKEAGVPYRSFDELYGQEDDYEAIYASMAQVVLEAALTAGQAAYALPGHPMAAEKSVQLLLEGARREGIDIEMRAGGSFMEAVMAALGLDPSRGVSFLDALQIASLQGPPAHDLIVFQIFNTRTASLVKLKLMEYFPDDYGVTLVMKAGIPGEQKILAIKLYELDRQSLDHLTSLYIPHQMAGMERLLMIMAKLRGEKGCPWDRQQDFRSLRPYVLEEAYEVVEAVNSGDDSSLMEELGDLLLQVVFFAQIAREKGAFDFWGVADSITEKIIRRHPHVFGSLKLSTAGEVMHTWEEIKKGEASAPSCLKDVGKGMTALRKAGKLQKKAAELGFDWPHIEGAWEKVTEELAELKEVYKMGVLEKIEDELGDIFFALVNVARFLEVDPEVALTSTNNKFCQRFAYIEAQVKGRGGDFGKHTLEELDSWWEKAKKINKNGKN